MENLKFEMEKISTENIKPSTQTPFHLKSHPLSRTDQLFSLLEYRTPLVLFYTAADPHHHLKASLSTTLSLFYPLAGRLSRDCTNIVCNDAGVPVVVARAKTSLSSYLAATNRIQLLPLFLPSHQILLPCAESDAAGESEFKYASSQKVIGCSIGSDGWTPLALQLTLFDCGGIAIGSHVLHKASIDGISRTHFFKTWAAIAARRYKDVVPPDFTTNISLFPPVWSGSGPQTGLHTRPLLMGPVDGPGQEFDQNGGGCIVKAFGFTHRSIAALQSMATSKDVANPTRVEAVSAFLWKHLIVAAEAANPSNFSVSDKERRQSVLIHSVNMRPHIRPPIPQQAFGKFTTHAMIHCDIGNKIIPDLVELVAMIRKVISNTKDIKFVSKFYSIEGEKATLQHGQKLAELKRQSNNKNNYIFASWGGINVDFGLGMPVWTGFMGGKVSSWFRNFVPLIDVPSHGIEAWLVLDEREMTILETNLEFLDFASPCIGYVYSPKSSL